MAFDWLGLFSLLSSREVLLLFGILRDLMSILIQVSTFLYWEND